MKLKEVGIWAGVITVLIGGLWFLVSTVNNSPSPSNPIEMVNLPPVSKDDFAKGPESDKTGSESARVTLIEYGDFQCPACAAYFPLVKQIAEEFGNELRIVHRFFPLTNIHKNAMLAAQTAFAAGLQGKFWEMHDKLYANQKSWAEEAKAKDIFIEYAGKLGLNTDQFIADFNTESTKKFITDQMNSGISIGINSTPSFFINSKKIENPRDYEAFKQIIQDALTK